jgi:hypothetical protein
LSRIDLYNAVGFYEPLKNLKLQTFSTVEEKIYTKVDGKRQFSKPT